MKVTIQIPSPIPYLMEVPDLRAHNTTYDWRLLFMLVLMGLGSGRTNLLAIAQWVQDQRDWLLSLGLDRRASGRALPAQATLYRFVWACTGGYRGRGVYDKSLDNFRDICNLPCTLG
ncbi:transposase family protein [Meiothermus sp. CFH 77666]|uniref:transposase family protein n=1 Tax=Meiothermus sp. CFH 77666 TaxID=2817942 RepID=UPI001AA0764C|nr:transposase family protein [Meiothermus sp. CFH 77666]MBO1436051.1 transposase family protein [Meiothermus sp. CFH 77666]